MRPFDYPKPVKPPIVRTLDALKRTFNEGMRISDREDVVGGLLIATRSLIAEQEIAQQITDEDRRDLAEYNKQVTAYNEAVRTYNAELKREQEEAEARRRTAKVRRARCDKCFMLHAPGQTECE